MSSVVKLCNINIDNKNKLIATWKEIQEVIVWFFKHIKNAPDIIHEFAYLLNNKELYNQVVSIVDATLNSSMFDEEYWLNKNQFLLLLSIYKNFAAFLIHVKEKNLINYLQFSEEQNYFLIPAWIVKGNQLSLLINEITIISNYLFVEDNHLTQSVGFSFGHYVTNVIEETDDFLNIDEENNLNNFNEIVKETIAYLSKKDVKNASKNLMYLYREVEECFDEHFFIINECYAKLMKRFIHAIIRHNGFKTDSQNLKIKDEYDRKTTEKKIALLYDVLNYLVTVRLLTLRKYPDHVFRSFENIINNYDVSLPYLIPIEFNKRITTNNNTLSFNIENNNHISVCQAGELLGTGNNYEEIKTLIDQNDYDAINESFSNLKILNSSNITIPNNPIEKINIDLLKDMYNDTSVLCETIDENAFCNVIINDHETKKSHSETSAENDNEKNIILDSILNDNLIDNNNDDNDDDSILEITDNEIIDNSLDNVDEEDLIIENDNSTIDKETSRKIIIEFDDDYIKDANGNNASIESQVNITQCEPINEEIECSYNDNNSDEMSSFNLNDEVILDTTTNMKKDSIQVFEDTNDSTDLEANEKIVCDSLLEDDSLPSQCFIDEINNNDDDLFEKELIPDSCNEILEENICIENKIESTPASETSTNIKNKKTKKEKKKKEVSTEIKTIISPTWDALSTKELLINIGAKKRSLFDFFENEIIFNPKIDNQKHLNKIEKINTNFDQIDDYLVNEYESEFNVDIAKKKKETKKIKNNIKDIRAQWKTFKEKIDKNSSNTNNKEK